MTRWRRRRRKEEAVCLVVYVSSLSSLQACLLQSGTITTTNVVVVIIATSTATITIGRLHVLFYLKLSGHTNHHPFFFFHVLLLSPVFLSLAEFSLSTNLTIWSVGKLTIIQDCCLVEVV